jgi:Mn-dependent DtxR family transcriptional regulator
MVPMNDAILSLFHSADLVLTPAIIAYNIDHSRKEVNRRLRKLEAATLVEKVKRGKYRITPEGEAYLAGELSPALPES